MFWKQKKNSERLEMMNVYEISKLSKPWRRILRNPLFFKLVDFLLDQNSGVILREIKSEFPQKGIEKVLEEAIELGVVQRKLRRYSVSLSFFSNFSEFSELVEKIRKLRERYPQVDPFVFYAVLGDTLREVEALPVLLAESDERNLQIRSLSSATQKGRPDGRMSYYFFYQPFSDNFSLPAYLKHVEEEKTLTFCEQELYELLGDVNDEYLFHFLDVILAKFIEKDTIVLKQKDIFLEALVKMGWLIFEGEGKYRLTFSIEEQSTIPSVFYEEIRQWVNEACQEYGVFSTYTAISDEISRYCGDFNVKITFENKEKRGRNDN